MNPIDGDGIDVALREPPPEVLGPEPDEGNGALGPEDPRFVERREEVQAGTRRRRRRIAGWVAASLVAVLGAIGIIYSPVLDVDMISVAGTDRLGDVDIVSVAQVRRGEALALLDVDAAQRRLADDPRILRARVTRRYPGTVEFRITERRAVARVAGPTLGIVAGEGGVVIGLARGDEELRTVEVASDPSTKVGARLEGSQAQAIDLIGSIPREISDQIEHVRIDRSAQLEFELKSGGVVLFGSVADAELKLLSMRTMLGPQLDHDQVCQLDVRVPTLPTVRRGAACKPPAAAEKQPKAESKPAAASPSTKASG